MQNYYSLTFLKWPNHFKNVRKTDDGKRMTDEYTKRFAVDFKKFSSKIPNPDSVVLKF